MIASFVDPRDVLATMHIWSLQELCAQTGDRKGGTKEELVARLVERHDQGLDQVAPESLEQQPEVEAKVLSHEDFGELFGTLKSAELAAILGKLRELRQTGSKQRRVNTLWESDLAEATLLSKLRSTDVANVLDRVGERRNGSKEERIERLIGHFLRAPLPSDPVPTEPIPWVDEQVPPALPAPEHEAPDDVAYEAPGYEELLDEEPAQKRHVYEPPTYEELLDPESMPQAPLPRQAAYEEPAELELVHELPEAAPASDELDSDESRPSTPHDPADNWLMSDDSPWGES